MNQNRRVVITGMGVVSPVGNSVETYWENLIAGNSGVAEVTRFEVAPYSTKVAAEVKDFNPLDHFDKREVRHLDLYQQYALVAARDALKDSALEIDKMDPNRVGVIIGTGIGGIATFEDQMRVLINRGPKRISPFFIPMLICDTAAGLVAMRYGLKGPNYAAVSACASASHAMSDSYWIIKRGEAEAMVTGGSENAICEISWAAFCAMRAMSTNFNEEPLKASRPFDGKRDGFVMGDGAGVVILEELEHALKRGARIYGEVIGAGMSADAYHITMPEPEGEGAAKAMEISLKGAGIKPEMVDYINTHGTATPLGDISEIKAIKKVFGQHAYEMAINSTKSIIGHLLGAAGGVEVIATLMTMNTGVVHPTLNQEVPDPECDLNCVPNVKQEREVNYAILNSFGFGGHNISIVLKRFTDQHK
ncbi:MAG: 3-oxoacyl-ACP synthase [candidate division Zixibacteria bacterium DG_27]|nr:MAG: 3-oxoacyl-ACP synthase [candidate division Zixibacteria bacterium DG_27]